MQRHSLGHLISVNGRVRFDALASSYHVDAQSISLVDMVYFCDRIAHLQYRILFFPRAVAACRVALLAHHTLSHHVADPDWLPNPANHV